MKLNIFLTTFLLFTFFLFSCNTDDGFIPTKDNTDLKCDSLYQYEAWTTKFKNATIKKIERIDTFKNISATFRIKATSLYLDSNNSILLDACVTLLKGSKRCEFSGYVHKEQYNQETDENVKTFSMASVQYFKKENGGVVSELKDYTIDSQGTIENLKPSNQRKVNLK